MLYYNNGTSLAITQHPCHVNRSIFLIFCTFAVKTIRAPGEQGDCLDVLSNKQFCVY